MNSTIHQKITNARKILILDYPFWGHLSLKLTLKEDESCKTGWTNGITLGYNPYWIETLSDKGTIAWCAHEVCHPMCQHHLRRAGRNYKLWQMAADFVVNSILVKENFDLPGTPLHDPRFNGMSTDEVFGILEKELEEEKRQRKLEKQGGTGESGGDEKNDDEDENKSDEGDDSLDDSSDSSSDPMDNDSDDGDTGDNGDSSDNGDSNKEDQENGGDDIVDAELDDTDPDPGNCGEVRDYPGQNGKSDTGQASPSERKQQEQDWKIATVQAATQAKQYGNMPAGLDAEIQNIVEPKVDPRDLLQRFVAMSSKNDFTWTLPNRRYIPQGLYLPSMKSEELGTVVLVLDTSISIGQKELDNFSAIVSAILEAYIIDATVLYCDTQVYEPEYFKREDLPLKLKMKGRGGTDFEPPYLWVKENSIDPVCLIYLTDLECDSYPDFIPDYPVMWICTEPEGGYWDKPPFGEVIYIDLEK
ncbi:hypothetical protein KA005_30455 [bacterium]|nr:hypothetical protein [bacterium]